MTAGSVVISTKLDNSGIRSDAGKMEAALKKFGETAANALSGGSKSVQNIRQKIVETNIAIQETQRQMKKVEESAANSGDATSKAFESAKLKVEQTRIAMGDLDRQMDTIAKTAAGNIAEFYSDPATLDAAVAKALEADKAYQKLGARYDSLAIKLKQQSIAAAQAQASAIASSGTQSREYKKLENRLASLGVRLQQYNSRLVYTGKTSRRTSAATRALGLGLGRLRNRIARLMVGVLVFNVLRKGFTELRNYLNATLKTSDNFNRSLSQVKGNLLIAFQPIYEAVLPHLVSFVGWLQKATAYIAVFTSALAGKTVKQSAQAAKNLNAQAKALKSVARTAKEASGSLAGFDEINRVGAEGVATGVDLPTTDFTGYQVPETVTASIQNFADKIKETWGWIVENKPVVDIALEAFGIGLLLIFGPNIVSKIIGFKFLYEGVGEVIKAVQQILEDGEITWETFTQLIGGAGGAIFGLGLILGKPKVAGFGLILWGASEMFRGLTDMINGNGDAWKNFERIVSGVAAVVGGIFLLLGGKAALMALAVGALALGILYLSQNWDKLTPAQRVLTILGALAAAAVAAAIAIAIFHTAWSVGIAAAAIAGGLALLAGTYLFTKSNAEIPTSGGASLSAAQSFGNQSFSGNPLPRLAKGAVIPANKEFIAVLGDQKHGRNLEGPESLFRQIVREESGAGGDITLNARIELEDGAVVGRVKRRFTRSGRLVGVYS